MARILEKIIVWRGSVSDLISDIAYELYPHEFEELKTKLNNGEGQLKTKQYPKRGEEL